MNAQQFPTACGTMTVARLQAALLACDPDAEVLVDQQGLPWGVARMIVAADVRRSPQQHAELIGYCGAQAETRVDVSRSLPCPEIKIDAAAASAILSPVVTSYGLAASTGAAGRM